MTSVQSPQGPGKEVDVALLVFIERYANDLLKWDLISFFAHNPDQCGRPKMWLTVLVVTHEWSVLS